jgi:hypothetical protein
MSQILESMYNYFGIRKFKKCLQIFDLLLLKYLKNLKNQKTYELKNKEIELTSNNFNSIKNNLNDIDLEKEWVIVNENDLSVIV